MTALDHVEALITGAHTKGEHLRFPHRFHKKPDLDSLVKYHTAALDRLGISWACQNEALNWINCVDEQKTWEGLYKKTHRTIARQILISHNYNCAVSDYRALVNSEVTALAGCNCQECPKPCIRKDRSLKSRFRPNHMGEACTVFIQG